MSTRITLVVAGALCLVILLGAAACGSKSSSSSATTSTAAMSQTEQWVSDVCTSLVTWKHNVASAVTSVKQNPTKEQLNLAAQHARDWTDALVQKLESLGKPGTSSGAEAKTTLSTLATQLSDGVSKIKDTAAQISGAKGSVEAVSVISSTLVTMRDQAKAAGAKLRGLPKGELEQAFQSSPACKNLTTNGTTA